MDSLKEVLSFLGAVFGLISALIPLLGYMADRRRRTSALAEARTDASVAPPEHAADAATAVERERHESARTRPVNRASFERAEQLVRTPAILMIVVGALSLTTNLVTAGIGYIDEFVVPLGIKPPRPNPVEGVPDGPFGNRAGAPERRTPITATPCWESSEFCSFRSRALSPSGRATTCLSSETTGSPWQAVSR